jgi:protein-disulfide isomerase
MRPEIVRDNSHMTNVKTAKVNLVEFGDFQCPACGAIEPVIEQILLEYKENKDFNFVFRNFPLPMHANAPLAAKYAEAAGKQGKYMEMHNLLYAKQKEWENLKDPNDYFRGLTQSLGLDQNKINQDGGSDEVAEFINQDVRDGHSLSVVATPTFFINNEKLQKVPTYEELKAKIDAALGSNQ